MSDNDPAPSSDDGPKSSLEPPKPDRFVCDIQLQNPCRYPEAGARRFRPFIEPLIAELAPEAGSFVVRFVSDREMQRLNRTYRQKDRPTDVLSFPGAPATDPWSELDFGPVSGATASGDEVAVLGSPDPEDHLGDVVISVPTAREQAKTRGHGVERELRILALHGVLHCLGYDHEADDGEMEALEQKLRRRFVPRHTRGPESTGDGR